MAHNSARSSAFTRSTKHLAISALYAEERARSAFAQRAVLPVACLLAFLPGCLLAFLPGCLATWLPAYLAAWLRDCQAACC